jgi:hypothetical protein
MVKEILTKISVVSKVGRRKGSVYRSPRIYLPTKLTDDSMFPFFEGDWVKVEVVKDRLVVRRATAREMRSVRRRR